MLTHLISTDSFLQRITNTYYCISARITNKNIDV